MATSHYRENKQAYLVKNRAYKQLFADLIWVIKSRRCADCGGFFPACSMDFDHVRGDKVVNVAFLAGRCTPALLLSEIKKCDIVCANCHRVRTVKRRGELNAATLESVVARVLNRRKHYDREVWEELVAFAGGILPPPAVVSPRMNRIVKKVGVLGTSWCQNHKAFVPDDRFEKNKSRWNGLQNQCVDCRKKNRTKRAAPKWVSAA